MSAPELKPCPFCGTSLEDDTHPGSTVEGGGFTFECGKCGANWPRMTREAMDGLDDEGIASFFNSRSDLRAAGCVILSPDEVRALDRIVQGDIPGVWQEKYEAAQAIIRSLKGGRDVT